MRTIRQSVFAMGLLAAGVAFAFGARSADVLDRSFAVGPGGTLTVEAAMGSIEVASGASDRVNVRIYRESELSEADFDQLLNEFDFRLEQFGNDVLVRVERLNHDRSWSNRRSRLQFRFEVEVPYQYNLDLATAGGSIGVSDLEGEVDAKTAGGSLRFGQIMGRVKGTTAGGSITLEGSNAEAELKTAGGSIRVGRVNGRLEAKTSGGGIDVEEVYGEIRASTSGGSVRATISAQPQGECHLSTSGGNVTVTLAEGIGVDLDAKTSSGRVHSDLAVQGRSDPKRKNVLEGPVGGGGPRLVLRTSGGNIEVRRAGR